MRRLVIPDNKEDVETITRWTADQLAEPKDSFGDHYSVCLEDEDGIVIAMVYHQRTENNVTVALAKRDGSIIAPSAIGDLLSIAFREPISAQRMTAFIKDSNQRSLDFTKKLGFTQEGRVRNFFKDGDAIILGLLKEEFEESRYGKQRRR